MRSEKKVDKIEVSPAKILKPANHDLFGNQSDARFDKNYKKYGNFDPQYKKEIAVRPNDNNVLNQNYQENTVSSPSREV